MVKAKPAFSLDDLRRRIDEIDDGLQDLLVRRAELVETVMGLKQSGGVAPFRPGREAQILRRLVARHSGAFPRASLVRLWRELLGATVSMQTDLSLAVCSGCGDLTRDHFGIRVPLLDVPSGAQVVLAINEVRALLGVVPLVEAEGAEPWWLHVLDPENAKIRVVARLPFGSIGNAMDGCADAFVIASMEPDPSGDDCTVFAIASPEELDSAALTKALLDVGIDSNPLGLAASGRGAVHLIEIDALLEPGDARIGQALARLRAGARAAWLGFYARPLDDASLGGIVPE